ncbi:hypothetical protein D3C72_1130160 [compost metagenome]
MIRSGWMTVTFAEPVTPLPSVALTVIRASPTLFALMIPVTGSTDTTPGLSDTQSKFLFVASSGSNLAMSGRVSPTIKVVSCNDSFVSLVTASKTKL